MDCESFDILSEDDFGLMEFADSDYIEEQCSSASAFIVIIEPLLFPCDGKCLTREACETYIEIRDVVFINLCDVSVDL